MQLVRAFFAFARFTILGGLSKKIKPKLNPARKICTWLFHDALKYKMSLLLAFNYSQRCTTHTFLQPLFFKTSKYPVPQKRTSHFTLNQCFRQSSEIMILRNHIEKKIFQRLGKWLWLLMWQMIHGRPQSPVVCDDMLSSAETKRLPISGELFLGALFSFKNATCLMINFRILLLGEGFTIHLTIF